MVDKLHAYEGYIGRLHYYRDSIANKWQDWRSSDNNSNIFSRIRNFFYGIPNEHEGKPVNEDYTHVYR